MSVNKIFILLAVVIFFTVVPIGFFWQDEPRITQVVEIDKKEKTTATSTPIIATTTAISKPPAKVVQKPTQVSKTIIANPPQTIQTQPEPSVDFEAINQFARKAIVNILCTSNTSTISSITGTGVIIDPRGIILTNAHIGQYWLVKDTPSKNSVECVIRTGNPAYPQYNAELMYISPAWIENNKSNLKNKIPTGTGENDYSFLHITKKIDNSTLPESFDFIPPNTDENVMLGKNVVLVSYPAGFLGGMTVLQNLNLSSAITTIQKLFTFKEKTIDVISVAGTIISQKGASGGAVIDEKSSLIGIITTSTDATTTIERELNAITISYINRDLQKNTNGGFIDLLTQNPLDVTKVFQNTLQTGLTKMLADTFNQ
jgi:S1-C subfamily serine protease